MEYNYQLFEIKLTPVNPYFFGKENSSELGNKTDYFQTSFAFPQQSTLLGMLRHKILRDYGINLDRTNYNDPNNAAATLIGKKGFDANSELACDYGHIHSVSPCFIIDDKANYLWDRSCEFVEVDSQPAELCLTKERDQFIIHNPGKKKNELYLSKKSHFPMLIGNNSFHKKDSLFHSNARPGTEKKKTSRTREDSFFIMEYNDLYIRRETSNKSNSTVVCKHKKISFGFLAAIREGTNIKTGSDFMTMGKEHSVFQITITPKNKTKRMDENPASFDFDHLHAPFYNGGDIAKCLFLSDAYVTEEDLKAIRSLGILEISNQRRFRYIKRNTQSFLPGARPVKESAAYNLIERGSVIFLEKHNKDELKRLINRPLAFKQIGYNYITFIQAKILDNEQ